MAKMSEEMENICMDIIQQIVSTDKNMNRQGAIEIVKKMRDKAHQTGKKRLIVIYDRGLHEFEIASDEDYELLRKQIFGS